MRTPRVILRWQDTNNIEIGHKIYRSDTPMDIQNMPPPHAILNPNTTEYTDEAVIEGNFYYYRVSAYTSNGEEFSNEVYAEAKSTTVHIHDIFFDNSSVATFNFDGNTNELGGNVILSPDNYGYSIGRFEQSLDCSTVVAGTITFSNNMNFFASNENGFSVSCWLYMSTTQNNGYIIVHSDGNVNNSTVLLRIFGGKIDVTSKNLTQLQSQNVVPNNTWIHVVVTHDSVDTKIFIDGILDNSRTGMDFTTVAPLYFSSWSTGGYRYTGLIDQLRFFNRALLSDEVGVLYTES